MLQFITHTNDRYDTISGAKVALEGGCRWVQLRMKDTPKEIIRQTALELKALCETYGATFIIDDEVEICKEVDAHGVHLGKNDMDPLEARQILGERKIIGGTSNTIEDIETLVRKGVNYIGLGPYQFTQTKVKLSPVLGLEGYAQIRNQMQAAGITLPVVAIGGITLADVDALVDLGYGIALSSTILNAQDPIQTTQSLTEKLKRLNP